MGATLEAGRMLRIGTVAAAVGRSPSWLRELEAEGSIRPPLRTVDGQRLYRAEDVEEIRRTVAARREAGRAGNAA